MPRESFTSLDARVSLSREVTHLEFPLALLYEAHEVAQLPFVLMTSFQSAFVFADIGGVILEYGGTYSRGRFSHAPDPVVCLLRALTESQLIYSIVSGPFPVRATDEGDLLRKRVLFTARLRGYASNSKTDRQRQEASALGGCATQ